MSWWQATECTSATIALVVSIILGITAIALFMLIITIPLALAFLIGSAIAALISFILVGKLLLKDGWSKLSTWCKGNVVLCIIVLIVLIAEIISLSVQHENVTRAVTQTTAPTVAPTEAPTEAPTSAPTTL